ncbi:MAG: condensation domain-containing protein, partial [Chitinophaga rupis]
QALVKRHAVLRTFFTNEFGERLLQVVRKEPDCEFTCQDVSGDVHFSIAEYKEADRARGFDLHKGSQMRLAILKLGDDTYEFIWSHHHILMDGWCVSILIREYFHLYHSLLQHKKPVLNKVYPYSDYIKWLHKIDKKKTLGYWRDYLSGYDTVASLPVTTVTENKEYDGRELKFSLEGPTRQSIRHLCGKMGITENTFFQTIWGALLGRYNNTDDVVFGSVVSGRPADLAGIEEMIGLFINTIPVRVRSGAEMPFSGLLKESHRLSIEGGEHHYVQLAEIQAETILGRNLFDHLLVFENYPVEDAVAQSMDRDKELALLSFSVFEQSNYDLMLTVIPGHKVVVRFNYNANRYEEAQIDRVKQHFIRFVEKVLEKPDGTVDEIDYLSEAERDQLLTSFNDTTVNYRRDKTVVALFEEQADQRPDSVAVVFESVELTYKELNERSNQLGWYLLENYAIEPEDLIGIKLERSEWMVIAILGVLKAGGAYVPIDPDYPAERISYMLEDSRCKVLIDEPLLAEFIQVKDQQDRSDLIPFVQPTGLAYVIYTSGSTGYPKGCMLEHRGLVNRLEWMWQQFGFRSDDIILQKTTFTFDVSVWELLMPLCWGARMVLCQKEDVRSPERILSLIEKQGITCLHFVPGMLSAFISTVLPDKRAGESLKSLRRVITSGEALLAETVRSWYGRVAIPLYNLYGPTEASIDVTYYATSQEDTRIPIGRP